MADIPVVTTSRLRLRGFRAEDLAAHRAAVDADPAVTWAHTRIPLSGSLRRWAERLENWAADSFGMSENDASRKVLRKLGFRHERDGRFYEAEGSLLALDRPTF